MELSSKDLRTIFTKLKVVPTESTHHVTGFVPDDEGNPFLPVYRSHGSKKLAGRAVHQFRKSLYLSVPELASLVRCTLSREAALAIAQARIADSPARDGDP